MQTDCVVRSLAHLAGWQSTAWAAYSMQQTSPPSQSVGIVQLGAIAGGFSHWSAMKSSGWTQLKYGAIFWAQQTVGGWQAPAVPHMMGPSLPPSF